MMDNEFIARIAKWPIVQNARRHNEEDHVNPVRLCPMMLDLLSSWFGDSVLADMDFLKEVDTFYRTKTGLQFYDVAHRLYDMHKKRGLQYRPKLVQDLFKAIEHLSKKSKNKDLYSLSKLSLLLPSLTSLSLKEWGSALFFPDVKNTYPHIVVRDRKPDVLNGYFERRTIFLDYKGDLPIYAIRLIDNGVTRLSGSYPHKQICSRIEKIVQDANSMVSPGVPGYTFDRLKKRALNYFGQYLDTYEIAALAGPEFGPSFLCNRSRAARPVYQMRENIVRASKAEVNNIRAAWNC